MLHKLNNTNGKVSNAVVNKQIKDLQEAVTQLRTDVDQQEIDIASIDSALDDKVSKAEQAAEVNTASLKAGNAKIDFIESKDEDDVSINDNLNVNGNISAGEASFTKVNVNGVDIVDDLNGKVSCARTDAANAVCTANDALSCACNVGSDLVQHEVDVRQCVNTVDLKVDSSFTGKDGYMDTLSVAQKAVVNELASDVQNSRAIINKDDSFIEPTYKDGSDFYQFHLPTKFLGRARFVGVDSAGEVCFSAIIDTAFSNSINQDREGTALIIHSGVTKWDFYQILRRKDRDQLSFITRSNIVKLYYHYDNLDKTEAPTYEIHPNLTDNSPDYTLYQTVYTAEHSDQVVILGNEDTLNGGLTIFGTFYASAFEVPETEVANVRVKHQIYGGFECDTGEYTTCGTPGGLITYNQRDTSCECNVSWINGCPRQIVRKGVCYDKDAYDNECSYLEFESVIHETTEYKPEIASDKLFDEASLAHYTGCASDETDPTAEIYPIVNIGDCSCVHGQIQVQDKIIAHCICADATNNLQISAVCGITECAADKTTNVTNNTVNTVCGVVCADYVTESISCSKTTNVNCGDIVENITGGRKLVNASCCVVVDAPETDIKCQTNVDYLTVKCGIKGRLETCGDLRVHGEIIADTDVVVHGDLYVEGTTTTTSESQVTSTGDYIVVRENNNTGLQAGEYAGLAVNNYCSGCMATITTDRCGTWRIADSSSTTSCCYTCVSNYDSCWYEGLTRTTTSVDDKGITVHEHAVELAEVAYYATCSAYYHKNGSDWYGPVTIDTNNHFDIGSVVADPTDIAALDALTLNDLVYYTDLEIVKIDNSQNQPILTREEDTDLNNNDILVWDATNKKATNATRPTISDSYPVSQIDGVTGEVSYCWKQITSSPVCCFATRTDADTALAIASGCPGYIPEGAIIMIASCVNKLKTR